MPCALPLTRSSKKPHTQRLCQLLELAKQIGVLCIPHNPLPTPCPPLNPKSNPKP